MLRATGFLLNIEQTWLAGLISFMLNPPDFGSFGLKNHHGKHIMLAMYCQLFCVLFLLNFFNLPSNLIPSLKFTLAKKRDGVGHVYTKGSLVGMGFTNCMRTE